MPVYNLATREDHIAPAKSVFVGSAFLGGPVRFVLTGSGHIAGVVNPPAQRKYQYWTGGEPKGSLERLAEAGARSTPGRGGTTGRPGSKRSTITRIKKKRRPGGGKLKPLEDAPGSYVMARA